MLIIIPAGLLEIIIRIGIDVHILFTGINLTDTGTIIESAFVVGAVGIGRCAFGRDAEHTNRTRHDNRKQNRKGFSQHSFHQIILPFRKPSSDPSLNEQSSGSWDKRCFFKNYQFKYNMISDIFQYRGSSFLPIRESFSVPLKSTDLLESC